MPCLFLSNSDKIYAYRSLHDIPQAMRFPMAGLINTIGFMTALTVGDSLLQDKMAASTIYSLSSILYLPIGHAVTSLIVFGWPKPYLTNLLMNVPIGMSGTAIGSLCTGMLVSYNFDAKIIGLLQTLNLVALQREEEHEDGQAYTNIMVIIITGIWGYILSVMVNDSKPKKRKHDKES